MVGSTKEGPNFAQSNLFLRGSVLRQLWTQRGLRCLGIKEVEIQWMGSSPHCFNHITPKSYFIDGGRSPLPLPMSTKRIALHMGSAPYVACPLTRFQHLVSFSPYL
jgi:hypothetical protein